MKQKTKIITAIMLVFITICCLFTGCAEATKVNYNISQDELVVTAKVGKDSYKKNYVYLNDYTLYVVEDINGTHTDPYYYQIYFNTSVLPDVEVKP